MHSFSSVVRTSTKSACGDPAISGAGNCVFLPVWLGTMPCLFTHRKNDRMSTLHAARSSLSHTNCTISPPAATLHGLHSTRRGALSLPAYPCAALSPILTLAAVVHVVMSRLFCFIADIADEKQDDLDALHARSCSGLSSGPCGSSHALCELRL